MGDSTTPIQFNTCYLYSTSTTSSSTPKAAAEEASLNIFGPQATEEIEAKAAEQAKKAKEAESQTKKTEAKKSEKKTTSCFTANKQLLAQQQKQKRDQLNAGAKKRGQQASLKYHSLLSNIKGAFRANMNSKSKNKVEYCQQLATPAQKFIQELGIAKKSLESSVFTYNDLMTSHQVAAINSITSGITSIQNRVGNEISAEVKRLDLTQSEKLELRRKFNYV